MLTATNATLVLEIKVLTSDGKYLSELEHSATTANPGKGKEKGRWTKANLGRFIVGGYCHTHVYRVVKDHYIGLSSNTVPQHKIEATCANPNGG